MNRPEPLPFRLRVPGRDAIDGEGAWQISYRIEGLLHLVGNTVTFEWSGTRQTQQVSFSGVVDDTEPLPIEWMDVPLQSITEVRLLGGWWRTRLELRARRLDAFDGVPSAKPGGVTLRIHRRDREIAVKMRETIEAVNERNPRAQ